MDRLRARLARWNLAARLDRITRDTTDTIDWCRDIADYLASVDLPDRITRLEALIMTSFAAQMTDLDVVTNAIADGYTQRDAIIAELRNAVANQDMVKAQALAAQDVEHANAVASVVARLRGLGADPLNPVPDTTPLPAPGTPKPLDPTQVEPVVAPAPAPDLPVVDPAAPLAAPSPLEPSDAGPAANTVIGAPGDLRA